MLWQWGASQSRVCVVVAHYTDVIMSTMVSQITSLTIVWSTVYSGADQRKHQSSASLAFVQGIHRWPVNSPHKWPVTRKMFPFHDVIMISCHLWTPKWLASIGRCVDISDCLIAARARLLIWVCRRLFPYLLWLPRVRGFWYGFVGVCSLTYCDGNFRFTRVSELLIVIL